MKKSLDSPRLRTKNNESKQRKVADEYVRLCGYKVGDNQWSDQNGLTLSQIASQLGTSKTNLKRALRIERNLTESMKELLDTGVITKTLAADVMEWMITYQDVRRNMCEAEKIYANDKVSARRIIEENEKRKLDGNKLGANITNNKSVCAQMDAERNKERDRSTNTREQTKSPGSAKTCRC